ncbi:MAG TPA: hypothetical protein VNO84_00545 [Burkholderiaceae bacterium]|nr:hypothetical protein [Burkholderiaceae bacterium]
MARARGPGRDALIEMQLVISASMAAAPSSASDDATPAHSHGPYPAVVDAAELRRAWSLLHRPRAPILQWEQRILMLSGVFHGRPLAWVHAIETRLEALRHETVVLGKPPTDAAFALAAQAPVRTVDDQPRFVPGSCRW